MQYYVYILTNKSHTVLYTGVTNDLVKRVYEHKNNADPNSFTAKYSVHKLVYFEVLPTIEQAIAREKQIKHYKRDWKNELVDLMNPNWEDLTGNIIIDPDIV